MNSRSHTSWRRLIRLIGLICLISLFLHADERDAEAAMQAALGHSPDMQQPERPAKLPDLTKGEELPEPRKGGPITWNMGPTGIVGIKNGGFEGDQVRVITVLPDSPADGKILPGDVVLGVQGTDFVAGGHLGFSVGNAIIKAEEEENQGIFTMHIWRDRNWGNRTAAKDVFGVDLEKLFREAEEGADLYEWKDEEERTVAVEKMAYDEFPIDGVHLNVTLQLKVMGTYSETSPWDCPVAEKIREDAWKVIAAKFTPDARGRSRGSWPGVLALVASGKPEYRELARDWVHSQKVCRDMDAKVVLKPGGFLSWHRGFGSLELAIYYDATGDDFVLPELRYRAIETAMGQNGGGSWGHTFSFPSSNGGKLHMHNPGYGALNAAGTRCFFLVALARKAGIEHPEIDAAIERASRFFGTYVDKGCVPYGYHSPYPSDDSNGKNYGAAYAFYVQGKTYEAKYFAMHSNHASFTRRGGHGSPVLWYYSPLSANISGPRGTMATMRNMRWFYTLARRHDGSFVMQGEQAGIGGKGTRSPTATTLLHYCAPLKQLVTTGKDADETCWFTDEEYDELLVSARKQISDPILLERIGKPWQERGTDELIDMLDHFYPNMRRGLARELAKRFAAGEEGIVQRAVSLLKSDEARMRDGACKTLSACGADVVLSHLSKVVALLKDDAEFVRMTAASTIGAATESGDRRRELELLKAATEDYPGMTMDNGNVRNAIKGVLFQRRRRGSKEPDLSKLGTTPFHAGYDEELVRLAMEKIVTMDPQGTVPGGWDRETLLKLAGPVAFAAAERQLNDAMFGGARKEQGQALLRKHGYREAAEGDAFNLMQRSLLERSRRRGVRYKDAFITPKLVKQAPGRYRGVLDDLYLWQQDDPTLVLSEKTGKGMPPIETPISLLIEVIERDTDNEVQPSIAPEVARAFQAELAAAGDREAQFALCRKELMDLKRRNYFRKNAAMTHLAETLGAKAIDDVSPFLGHEHWRVREHAHQVAVSLVKQGGGEDLLGLFAAAAARESGLLGNWNAAGILDALAAAGHEPALAVAESALKHPDPLVRKAAVQAVFTIGGDPELKTVFAFMRSVAAELEDFHGVELALLSKRDDPAHVQRVSKAARTLLSRAEPPLRRSLAWVLGQFGGTENLAAIEEAAAATEDDGELGELTLALAYSPDPAAGETMLALAEAGKRVRDVVVPLSIHRMVGRNGMGDVTDEDRVKFARGILNLSYEKRLVDFLGRVHTAQSMQLLFDVMKMNPETAAKSIIECAEGIHAPSKRDARIATDVLADVVEYIEVAHVRGGAREHMATKEAIGAYAKWKGLQARAGQVLLKFHKPEVVPMEELDDLDLGL